MKRRKSPYLIWLAAGLCAALVPTAQSAELFELRATNPRTDVTFSANNLPDLVEEAVKAQDRFAAFQGAAFLARLKYADVDNALNLDVNDGGTRVVLTSPLTGLRREFVGASRDDVENQIEDYLCAAGRLCGPSKRLHSAACAGWHRLENLSQSELRT